MNLTREHWTQADYNDFIKYLKTLADSKYKEFSDSLVPGIEHSFGIRIPILRDTAKKISKGNYNEFLACKKGVYREEIMLEGLVMTLIKCDYPQMLEYIKVFADKIIEYFIYHENPWVVRFGFGCLLEFYLTDEYIDRVLEYVDSINSDFYYVQMMQGWLIATAVAKCRDKAIKFLQYNNLNATTQNMAVRKIRESNRISKEDKDLVIQFKK